ncbi:peptide chain release factor N(5)-glutamine methyltransferase [Staphylococcus schleiferi]|uniref:peptide chain release factor N(5)-glutamine methyltransferase n=1 Tax=Staphylococcus schleiferi TaxID=1295 RepID=UPI0021D00DC2|nr:peptide chain release factor N(5)-glutamine methyltransferase [Staphylococcus schleiferi]UXR55636.1 peptide chain release factor N(5)-glutamine methyltransferase [Staphylococcus schleiferi]
MNYNQWIKDAKQKMAAQGYEENAVEWLVMDLCQWSRTQMILNEKDVLSQDRLKQLEQGLSLLLKGMPVQYVVEQAHFYGRIFKVNPNVLIPRPETEEVVHYFLNQIKPNMTVADVGVGSGIIAVTLKAEMNELIVYGSDISKPALSVAQKNAKKHNCEIHFMEGDALKPYIERGIQLEGLISNPPYISKDEVNVMGKDVLEFEPHLALFAEEQGYQVYKALIRDLPSVMCDGAPVVFEIGYQQGEFLTQLMQSWFSHIKTQVINDINGQPRIFTFNWHKI